MVKRLTSSAFQQALKIPHVENGMSVGLFGGSFNPPHDGHCHVAQTALKRLQLDRLWWIVSPGNPHKNNQVLPELKERIALSRALMRHPKVMITGLEARLNTRFSADLVFKLTKRFPCVNFVWIMGADNLTSFHKWDRWQEIAENMPICVIDRPGDTLSTRSSLSAKKLMRYRLDEADAAILKYKTAPAWTFIHAPRSFSSSTALRVTHAENSSDLSVPNK